MKQRIESVSWSTRLKKTPRKSKKRKKDSERMKRGCLLYTSDAADDWLVV